MQKEAGKGTSCGGDPHEGIKIDPNGCKEGMPQISAQHSVSTGGLPECHRQPQWTRCLMVDLRIEMWEKWKTDGYQYATEIWEMGCSAGMNISTCWPSVYKLAREAAF